MRQTVFEDLAKFKDAIQAKVGEVSEAELLTSVDHVNRVNEGTRHTALTEREQLIRNVMLEEGLKGRTVIVWLRASQTWPKPLKEDIRAGRLSLTKAMMIARDYHMRTDNERNESVLRKIRSYVADLRTGEEG